MIRNYLLITLRNFQRQKFFALTNMFGLALGLASAILIFLYVSDELQYDVIHPDYKNTYRIGSIWKNNDGQVFENTVSPGYWIKYLRDNRSEVVNSVRVDYIGYPTTLHHRETDKIILTEEIKWAEPGFDKIVYFKLLQGNQLKMFDDYNTMLISESGAKKLFGDADPMGEVVTVRHNFATQGRDIDVVITGVYEDFPSNSHFKAKYILNVNALRTVIPDFETYMEGRVFTRQSNIEFFENYVVLKPGSDIREIEKLLKPLGDQMTALDSNLVARGWKLTPFSAKVEDLHFDQKNLWENDSTQGDKKYLAIFSAVAVLILIIACINYMNLATARAGRRAKEVGLRKSLGSKRAEIAKQFFYESTIMTLGSLFLAIILVVILLQPFNELAHKSFTIGSLLNPYMILIILGIVSLMAFLSGSYPAIYLSGFRPMDVLKGQIVKGKGAEFFRKTLVTIQYVVSLVLIISTFIVIRQMQHMQNTKLNEHGSQILSIRYGGTAPQNKFEAFRSAVLQDRDIEHVTMGNHLPRLNYFGFIGSKIRFPEFDDKEYDWNQLNVDFFFQKTFGLEFIAGRDFQPENVSDSTSVILNEAALKALNQPIDRIIGATISMVFDNNRQFKVIGVVKDFPYKSMHEAIAPLILNPRVHFVDRIAYIKLPAGKFQEKIQSIEKTWKEIFPGVGFDYWFLGDEFNRMYVSEGRVASLSKTFAALAILITALGVFGLASYTAEQKTKEVGIRKVLGASIPKIVSMFAWLFIKIFLVAAIIAVPVAYLMANYWLKDFAYRSPIDPLIFGVSLTGLLLVTMVTVSYETWKAARTNPVNSLRSE
jgi:putative ABC transport system permease protein